MSTFYSPSDKGFSERLSTIDRAQVALLRELSGHKDLRLALKGGMAMRVAFGSMRLTKDIDFDRDPSLSTDAVKNQLKRGLLSAAQAAGMRNAAVEITKASDVTVRARLAGKTHSGVDVRFEVEVSGRTYPVKEHGRMEMVHPPSSYGIAAFPVLTYTNDMMAAMKVLAVLADMRNVPRDVFDLNDLIGAGVNPVSILSTVAAEKLAALKVDALAKLEQINFDLARQELLPYLPPSLAEEIDEAVWDGYLLNVSEKLESWIAAAEKKSSAVVTAGDTKPKLPRKGQP